MELTKNEIIGLIQYTSGEMKEDLIDVTEQDAESVLTEYLEAINYTRCCKSDSELFYCYLETDKKCEKQCSYCLHIEGSE